MFQPSLAGTQKKPLKIKRNIYIYACRTKKVETSHKFESDNDFSTEMGRTCVENIDGNMSGSLSGGWGYRDWTLSPTDSNQYFLLGAGVIPGVSLP